MKEITFRPLRRVKKTGKIVVASYMQWNKVRCGNYSKFKLTIDNEYKDMPLGEYVYDHEGEQLYFFTYDPWEIPVFTYPFPMDISEIFALNEVRAFNWGSSISYAGKGIDCCGTPIFSHLNASYAADYRDIDLFEPLTVGMVIKWLGWFLYQLENSTLQIGR